MAGQRKKLENAYTEEEKRSHLPCAGIILFRFYGYYLSQMVLRFQRGNFSTPGTFENRFSAGNAKICIRKLFLRLIKIMQHLPDSVVFYPPFIIKTFVMKKIVFAVLAMISILAVNAQSGEKNVQKRQVSGFHGVDVSGGIDLYLSYGPESVAISASTEVRDHIVTKVVNGILQIHMEENWSYDGDHSKMKAYVSLNNLKSLEGSGGGDIIFENLIKAEDLNLQLSGGGSLKGKLNANHLVINQSGGSNVKLSGDVKNLTLNASGGGNLNGFDLVTDYASIHASGGSATELTVNKELRAVVSGGGDITYKGAASVKEIKSSGGGSVTHKD
jgi:hypothetical protein